MANRDLYVNESALMGTFSAIESDISAISDTLSRARSVMGKLDSSVWKAREKDKIDQEFVPYLNSFVNSYPGYLKNRLDFAIKAVGLQKQLDQQQSQLSNVRDSKEIENSIKENSSL